jgi:hypothetical protein
MLSRTPSMVVTSRTITSRFDPADGTVDAIADGSVAIVSAKHANIR